MKNDDYGFENRKKDYLPMLEDITKNLSESNKLPKGYNKIKSRDEKANLLESKILKSLNRKYFYKIYLSK